jgi:hypothetical protein
MGYLILLLTRDLTVILIAKSSNAHSAEMSLNIKKVGFEKK